MSLPERHRHDAVLRVAILAGATTQFVQLKNQLKPHHIEVVFEARIEDWRAQLEPGQADVLLVEMEDEGGVPDYILDALLEQVEPPVLFNDSATARFASMRSGERVWGRKLAEKLRALAAAPRPRAGLRPLPVPAVAVPETAASDTTSPAFPVVATATEPACAATTEATPAEAFLAEVSLAERAGETGAGESPSPRAAPGPAPAAAPRRVRHQGASGGLPEVWVLAASIGGPQVVKEFLASFEAPVPAVFVLAQHIGSGFIRLLAEQLDQAGVLNVALPEAGGQPQPGHVYVAPVDFELGLTPEGRWHLHERKVKSLYAPSIDQVMSMLAEHYSGQVHAMVFSGMGGDGLEGCRRIHLAGGEVWVQAPETCVVSAMVDTIRRQGLDSFSGSPRQLARHLVERLQDKARNPA